MLNNIMVFEVDETLTNLLKNKKIVAVASYPISLYNVEYEINSSTLRGRGFTFFDGEIYVIFSDGTALKIAWPSSGYMEYIEEFRNENDKRKKLIDKITKEEKLNDIEA